jgi:hypothetical protein
VGSWNTEAGLSMCRRSLLPLRKGGSAISKLLGFVGATVGGGVGWWLGALHGIMTAFIVSMVGTGVGIYVGRRVADMLGG